MKICNKLIQNAKNGNSRGTCCRPKKHNGYCGGNQTCSGCGIKLTIETAQISVVKYGSGLCVSCKGKDRRKRQKQSRFVYQEPGKRYTFPCGCSGILPESLGQNSKFVSARRPSEQKPSWVCRVANLLQAHQSKHNKYARIDRKTPHSVIRAMMEEPNCHRCKQPLKWEFGEGKTPHLHHNHETGKIYGFTHAWCNPRYLEKENNDLYEKIDRLTIQIQNLQQQLSEVGLLKTNQAGLIP